MDKLSEKYYSFSPYNYSYNNPVRFVDPDGNGPIDEIVDAGKKIVASTVRKVVDNAINYAVEVVKDAVEKVEVTPYAEGKASITAGGQGAAKIEGAGYKVNLGSVELLEVGVGVDKNGFNGEFDYIGKNNEVEVSQGAGLGLEGVDIEGGKVTTFAMDSEENKVMDKATGEKVFGEVGVGVPGVTAKSTYSKESDYDTGSSKTTITTGLQTSKSSGHGFLVNLSFEVGIKLSF